MYQLGRIYDAIARLLPSEGRDYLVSINTEKSPPTIRINGKTPIGAVFADHCMKNLMSEIKQENHG